VRPAPSAAPLAVVDVPAATPTAPVTTPATPPVVPPLDDAAYDVAAGAGTSSRSGTGDDALTLSEERLDIGTKEVETGRAALRKRVVEEEVTTTVPVTREKAVVETEPVTDANLADSLDGPEMTEREHEVVLHAEEPVVTKETVPVERVKLGTETVTEDVEVTETVRSEQAAVDGDADERSL